MGRYTSHVVFVDGPGLCFVGPRRRAAIPMNLRRIFLLPAALVTVLLFLVPMAIILAFSLMTRGPYGGQGLPWTLENYRRFLKGLDAGQAPALEPSDRRR